MTGMFSDVVELVDIATDVDCQRIDALLASQCDDEHVAYGCSTASSECNSRGTLDGSLRNRVRHMRVDNINYNSVSCDAEIRLPRA